MAMVFGAFEQQVSLLFMDEGVYALRAGQDASAIGFKDVFRTYASLEKYYDIAGLYVEQASLEMRGLQPGQLCVPVKVLDQAGLSELFRDQDFLLSI